MRTEKELLENALALLRVAVCSNCNGNGIVTYETGGCDMDGENDTRECQYDRCQWCDELAMLMKEAAAPNV